MTTTIARPRTGKRMTTRSTVPISESAHERFIQSEAVCFELLSACQHDPAFRLPKLVEDELDRWNRMVLAVLEGGPR